MATTISNEKPFWYVILKDFGITTLVALACMYGFWMQLQQAATERAALTAAALLERKEMLKSMEDDRKEFRESIKAAVDPVVEELKDLNKAVTELDNRLGRAPIEATFRPPRRQ